MRVPEEIVRHTTCCSVVKVELEQSGEESDAEFTDIFGSAEELLVGPDPSSPREVDVALGSRSFGVCEGV